MAAFERCTIATPADNDELVALSRQVAMRASGMSIAYERGPDYFAACRESGKDALIGVFKNKDGRVSGTASLILRDAVCAGERIRYGYFCDLRTAKLDRKTWLEWLRYYEDTVRFASQVDGVGPLAFHLTTVIDSNERALKLLRDRLPGIVYQPLAPYAVGQMFMRLLPRSARVGFGISVRRATLADAPALRAFLAAENALAGIGDAPDELDRQLAVWPAFTWASFILATDAGGAIVGCVAPRLGTSKKPVVRDLSLAARAFAPVTALFGAKRVRDGEPLDVVYACHFHARGDQARAVRRALLVEAFRTSARGAAHSLCWLEWPGDPTTVVDVNDFLHMRTRGTLYQVTLRGADPISLSAAPALDVSTL